MIVWIIGLVVLAVTVVTVGVSVVNYLGTKDSQRRVLAEAQRHMLDAALGIPPIDMPPRRPLPLWSEEERELFGYNDTEEFIKETDTVLKGIEWDQKISEMSDAERIIALSNLEACRALGVPSPVFQDGEWKPPRPYVVSDTPAGLNGTVAVETTKDLSSLRARPERPDLWAKGPEDEEPTDHVFAWGQVDPVR